MQAKPFPKRSIHLDFHTLPSVRDVGRAFDADTFARTLSDAGTQSINVFAKCNLGCAYYPTNVGIMHPSLQFDMLGQMIEACHRNRIQVIAYFNAGLDHEQAQRHRDWCKLNDKGQVYSLPDTTWFFRQMCLNTAYGDFTYQMIGEMLQRYPVDGIFLDCFQTTPCYGIECIKGMKSRGIDVHNPAQVQEYTYSTTVDFAERVSRLVESIRPGISITFNGLEYSI